jgi:hypothetical protein
MTEGSRPMVQPWQMREPDLLLNVSMNLLEQDGKYRVLLAFTEVTEIDPDGNVFTDDTEQTLEFTVNSDGEALALRKLLGLRPWVLTQTEGTEDQNVNQQIEELLKGKET